MSMFQCARCGCAESSSYTTHLVSSKSRSSNNIFDWTRVPGLSLFKGKELCSACLPSHYSDGDQAFQMTVDVPYGQWHGVFPRVFLPKHLFKTNQDGNLEHVENGETDYTKYELPREETGREYMVRMGMPELTCLVSDDGYLDVHKLVMRMERLRIERIKGNA